MEYLPFGKGKWRHKMIRSKKLELLIYARKRRKKKRVKIRRIIKFVGCNERNAPRRRMKGEKLLEAHLDRHHLLISLNRHRFFCRLIFRILLNYNETLWGLAKRSESRMAVKQTWQGYLCKSVANVFWHYSSSSRSSRGGGR